MAPVTGQGSTWKLVSMTIKEDRTPASAKPLDVNVSGDVWIKEGPRPRQGQNTFSYK